MSTFIQLLLRSFETGSIYALATLAIILVYKTNRIINFSHASIAMFATYFVTYIIVRMNFSMPLAFALGFIVAIIVGILVDVIVIESAKKVPPLSKMIITLGVMMVIIGLIPIFFGVETMNLKKIIQEGSVSFLGASISYNGLFNIVLGLSIMIGLFYLLQKTRWGLALRASASNEVVAKTIGIPTGKISLVIWGSAGVLGLLSGIMVAPVTSVNMGLMDKVQVMALIACVLGGFQTFYGPVIAAYLLGIASNILLFYGSSVWGEQILLGLILLVIVFKPHGIFGKEMVKKV